MTTLLQLEGKGRAAPPVFTEDDRRDFAALTRELDRGLGEERRSIEWVLHNAKRMRAVRARGLHGLDGAAGFEAWVLGRYGIKKKQVHKYLRIGEELEPRDFADRGGSLNGAYQVALAPRPLRPLLIALGSEGLPSAALAHGRRVGEGLLKEAPPGADPAYLPAVLAAVERAARNRTLDEEREALPKEKAAAPSFAACLRACHGRLRQANRDLIEAEKRQRGQALGEEQELLEAEARANLLALCRIRARAEGRELRQGELEALLDRILPREEAAPVLGPQGSGELVAPALGQVVAALAAAGPRGPEVPPVQAAAERIYVALEDRRLVEIPESALRQRDPASYEVIDRSNRGDWPEPPRHEGKCDHCSVVSAEDETDPERRHHPLCAGYQGRVDLHLHHRSCTVSLCPEDFYEGLMIEEDNRDEAVTAARVVRTRGEAERARCAALVGVGRRGPDDDRDALDIAIDAAIAYEQERGARTCYDLSEPGEGYDLVSVDEEGARTIRVVAMPTLAEPLLLLEDEWATLRRLGATHWLYLVYETETAHPFVIRIRDLGSLTALDNEEPYMIDPPYLLAIAER